MGPKLPNYVHGTTNNRKYNIKMIMGIDKFLPDFFHLLWNSLAAQFSIGRRFHQRQDRESRDWLREGPVVKVARCTTLLEIQEEDEKGRRITDTKQVTQ